MAEDSVCLADYCDIMRCKVLVSKDSTLSFGDSMASTDIEIWSEATAYRTALTTSGPRDLAKLPARFVTSLSVSSLVHTLTQVRNVSRRNFLPSLLRLQSSKSDNEASDLKEQHCDKVEAIDINGGSNDLDNGMHLFNKTSSIIVTHFH